MKKQYVLRATLKNGKVSFLTEIINGYPKKSACINEAVSFSSKAKAWAFFKQISPSNIGWECWELIER